MDEIDAWAKAHEVSRSESIRELIKAGLRARRIAANVAKLPELLRKPND
jgi:metal-responsive CopG/Arc/MetJ family transcriptional regulator